jgi:hypothetical protein
MYPPSWDELLKLKTLPSLSVEPMGKFIYMRGPEDERK